MGHYNGGTGAEYGTKKIDKNVLKRLLAYAKPYSLWFLLTSVCIVVIVFLELYQPIIIGQASDIIIDGLKNNVDLAKHQIIIKGLLYAATIVLALILTYVQALILSYVGQKVILTVRKDVFGHLETLSMDYFNKNPIGKLVTRATNDIETLNEMYTSVIVNVLKSIVMLLGIIITMFSYNVKLSLITFSVIPFIIIFTLIFRKVSRANYRKIRAKISSLNAFVAEHVSGMKIVQIFAAEEKMFKQFKSKTESLKKQHIKQIWIYSIYRPSNFMLKITAWILLLYFGGAEYLAGNITIGTIIIFQRYITKFFEPIQSISEQLDIVQSASASAERIFKLLDEEPTIKDSDGAIEIEEVKGEIEFKNVWFAYKGEDWILKDVSFKAKPGQNIAFVGATGAGKTTIQNLITRYYDIQMGQILIDGIDIKNIKLNSLRGAIGQMLQDVFLFTGDIKSNIRLKNENITDEEIMVAANYVNASNFIEKLDDKYDEKVIERGSSLSAGQRQLLSFARTLAFKPKILILDEATANIDTETEILIQDALDKLMQNRTTLIVAHRLSTIQNSDKIIVMDAGRIKEEGSHQELLNKQGAYFKLYQLQLQEK